MTHDLSAEASQALSALERKWPKLQDDVDRGEALGQVHGKGVPYRLLAEKIGSSESRVRYLCQADKAPVSDRLLAREKKITTRELVRRARTAEAEKKAKENKAVDLQRTQEAKKGANIICDWLKSENIEFGSSCAEQIVGEAQRILHGAEQRGTLPNAAPPPARTPIAHIIERCRPKEAPSYFFVAHYAEWLAFWSYYAFPDPIVRERALNIALDAEIKGDR